MGLTSFGVYINSNMKSLKLFFVAFCFFIFTSNSQAQSTLSDIVRDTIVRIDKGLTRPFLLDGKPISTEVMIWFMQDHPDANRHIKTARVIETFSSAFYTIGFTWVAIDLLTNEVNELDWFLAKSGFVAIGAGLACKWLANKQKKKAIRHYNDDIINAYRKKDVGLKLQSKNNGLGFVLNF